MSRGRFAKRMAAVGISAAALTSVVAAVPAQAAQARPDTVYADCTVGDYGKNHDGVWISCGDVVGGQARGRADCKAAPDIYTDWVGAWTYAQNGFCWFSMRGAVMETRAH